MDLKKVQRSRMDSLRSHLSHFREWYFLHLLLGVTFIVSGILINFIQLVFYTLVRPFNVQLYQRLNYYCVYSIYSQLIFLCEWWSGSECHMFATPEDYAYFGKEKAIIIMNHTYEVDWLMGWIVADRFQILGAAKVYAKMMLKYVPIIGWAWNFSDIVFLERNWEKDKKTLGDQIAVLMDYPFPVWLLLFAEGTRFTPKKREASNEFARKQGWVELKHHLLPRTKGFSHTMVHVDKKRMPAVYDVTIGFNRRDGFEPTLKNLMMGRKVIGQVYTRRILTEDIPTEEEACGTWLRQLYQEKDQILDTYLKTGSFTEGNQSTAGVQRCAMDRRFYSLINFLMLCTIVNAPILYLMFSLLASGSTFYICLGIGIIAFVFLAIHKLIGLTRIEKGSAYGSTSPMATPKKEKKED